VTGVPQSERAADAVAEERIASSSAVEACLGAVKDAERRGELLTAVDMAEQGLADHPDELWLKHHEVLALARAGATEEAAKPRARSSSSPWPKGRHRFERDMEATPAASLRC
jgi:hypothetical protein